MPTTDTTEKRFELDIADFLLSPAGRPVCLSI